MDIQLLAALLLIGRLVSEYFIVRVLIKQWEIRNTKTHPRLLAMRRVLSLLAILVFVGNLYPLWLDIYTLFIDTELRASQTVGLYSVVYSLDNNLTFVIASILIWVLYKLADVVIEVADLISPSKKQR